MSELYVCGLCFNRFLKLSLVKTGWSSHCLLCKSRSFIYDIKQLASIIFLSETLEDMGLVGNPNAIQIIFEEYRAKGETVFEALSAEYKVKQKIKEKTKND